MATGSFSCSCDAALGTELLYNPTPTFNYVFTVVHYYYSSIHDEKA